jgi:hypothetical protein
MTHMNKTTLLAACAPFLLSACSSMDIYETLQDNAQYHCRKLALTDPERVTCLQRNATDYATYQQQRAPLLGRPANSGKP